MVREHTKVPLFFDFPWYNILSQDSIRGQPSPFSNAIMNFHENFVRLSVRNLSFNLRNLETPVLYLRMYSIYPVRNVPSDMMELQSVITQNGNRSKNVWCAVWLMKSTPAITQQRSCCVVLYKSTYSACLHGFLESLQNVDMLEFLPTFPQKMFSQHYLLCSYHC